jgi:molybdopterin molybdotransferase
MPERSKHQDVRMRGFTSRTTVEATLAWIDAQAKALSVEQIPLGQAAGRVLATDIISRFDVPNFTRSMMDGYALQATSTLGATAYNPLELDIIGQSLPGEPFSGNLRSGAAVRIMTGAALPAGADAVLPAERTETSGRKLRVIDDVSPGKNVSHQGEDIVAGATVLRAGRILRPQDLGLLASIGQAMVPVIRRPMVNIVTTGNELLPAGSEPTPQHTIDANGPMLAALVTRDGGLPCSQASGRCDPPDTFPSNYIIRDDPAAILAAVQAPADITIVTGGSSVGQEDYAPALLAEHGELAIHGIAMRPSSPTGMGLLDGRLVFLLPGNPVSCLCAYDFFAGRAIRLLGGRPSGWHYRKTRLPLARKLVSQVGRVDYARVRVIQGSVEPIAISGASILSSTTLADGFVVIAADSEGFAAGDDVDVHRYDETSFG